MHRGVVGAAANSAPFDPYPPSLLSPLRRASHGEVNPFNFDRFDPAFCPAHTYKQCGVCSTLGDLCTCLSVMLAKTMLL